MEKISVIIPVFNVEKYLNNCINSIVNQTYKNLEIILVDDGSTDSSGELCDNWALKDNRIIVIHQKNSGVSVARNVGLKASTGNFISFIDSDDEIECDMYSFLIDLILTYNSDISHCGYKRLNERGEVIKECSGTHKIMIHTYIKAISNMIEGKYFSGSLWNKLYKKKTIGNCFFEKRLKNNEDILFNVMVFQRAHKIVFGDETKYCYYERKSSACNNMNYDIKINNGILATEIMIKGCTNPQLYSIFYKRLFLIKSGAFRNRLIDPSCCSLDYDGLRHYIKSNYRNIKGLTLKYKINYFMMMYMPNIYKFIYKVYDRIRKPNWDVK